MKLITINTHSLIEENYQEKLKKFVDFICREQPDIIAMQEVNQSSHSSVCNKDLKGYAPISDKTVPIRQDNHALQAAFLFHVQGLEYYWTWLPVKIGYGKYDEGVAIFSKTPITDIDYFYISSSRDYSYWKTRQVLGIKTEGSYDWFYTVHMGWWNDEEDPFPAQWKRFEEHIFLKKQSGNIWLMGDFNSPAEVRKEGYDLIKTSGYFDTFMLAKEKDSGITVEGLIDGWRDKVQNPDMLRGMRIDQIWCKNPCTIYNSQVIFNGQNIPVISDHFGVMIKTE